MWKNNMANIARVGALTAPQFRNMPTLDLGGAFDNYVNARDKSLADARRQAYVDELTEQHPEAAAQIAANPDAYMKMLNDKEAAERDQQYKMDQLQKQFDLAMARDANQHANAVGLAKLAAQLKGNAPDMTAAERNVQAMIATGKFTPEEAWAVQFAGGNPTLDMSTFGKKGGEALDKKRGENYAEDLNAYNNLVANLPTLEAMVEELDTLADKGTHTTTGRVIDTILKEGFDKTSSGALASAGYETRVNQNLLPLLRQTFGAAFTEKDREALTKTLGNPFEMPAIKKDTLKSFIENKKREIESKRRKLESYNPYQTGSQTIIDASEYFK